MSGRERIGIGGRFMQEYAASYHSKLRNNEIVNLYQYYIFNFREKY